MTSALTFTRAQLVVVSAGDLLPTGADLAYVMAEAFHGGADIAIIRERSLQPNQVRELVRHIRSEAPPHAQMYLDGLPDLALELGTGLHLPESFPKAREIVSSLRGRIPISRSIHDLNQVDVVPGVDFLIAGHIFDTESKAGTPGRGLPWLRSICQTTPLPAVAIGGIDQLRVGSVMETGAVGVAVIRAVLTAADPRAAAQDLRIALDRSRCMTREEITDEAAEEPETKEITVTVNGKSRTVPTGWTILDLLRDRQQHERMVAVELNSAIIRRELFAESTIHPGDQIEVVHFVGGG